MSDTKEPTREELRMHFDFSVCVDRGVVSPCPRCAAIRRILTAPRPSVTTEELNPVIFDMVGATYLDIEPLLNFLRSKGFEVVDGKEK
jgi:hypothetical protein